MAREKPSSPEKAGDIAARALARISGPRIAPPQPCMANGCPLTGTFNPITYDEGKSRSWQCFIHSDLPMSSWPEATTAIRRHLEELRSIPNDGAFRNAMRDAIAGKEVSRKYWEDDGVCRNAYAESIRAARKKK